MFSSQQNYTTAEIRGKLELSAIEVITPKTKRTTKVTAPFPAANDGYYEGARNSSLFSLAGSLRARGMDQEGILAVLIITNRDQVKPPLTDIEVAGIAASIMRYPAATNATELRRSLNDIGNANRLTQMYGAELRYIPEMKSWMYWDGGRWQFDHFNIKITECAKMAIKAIYMEALNLSDNDLAVEVAKFAGRSHHLNRLEAMIKLASKDAAVVIRVTLLDADPMRLGVANGVVDLNTGKLIPNQLELYITKFSTVTFDSRAKCPTFLTFLDRIFESKKDVVAYMRRVIGYGLTGRTDAQVLFFYYGIGANGKSTLLNVVELLLGADLAKQTPPETLMAKKQGNNASNDLARLKGVRVVLSNEIEDGSLLAETTVKQLTGGDTITARFLFKEFFEFKPEFKIIIAGNHKPVIRGTDYGIWRRIHMVAFPVVIPAAERDPLLSKKLEQELSGILNWAVKGCLEWQHDGLKPPTTVTAAVEEYRDEMDVLGHWITEHCVAGPEYSERVGQLYSRYRDWAVWGGYKPMTIAAFGRRLGERGFTKQRVAGGMVYQGLMLGVEPICGV